MRSPFRIGALVMRNDLRSPVRLKTSWLISRTISPSQRTPSTRPIGWDHAPLLVSEFDQFHSFGQGYAAAGVLDDACRQRIGVHDGPVAVQDEHRFLNGIDDRVPASLRFASLAFLERQRREVGEVAGESYLVARPMPRGSDVLMTEDPVELCLVPDGHVHHRRDAAHLEIGVTSARECGRRCGARPPR
jgi:hypothetical protein